MHQAPDCLLLPLVLVSRSVDEEPAVPAAYYWSVCNPAGSGKFEHSAALLFCTERSDRSCENTLQLLNSGLCIQHHFGRRTEGHTECQ